MFQKLATNLRTTRRRNTAMRAARHIRIYGPINPTVTDLIDLVYGRHGIRLEAAEARDALAAEHVENGSRLND